MPVKPKRQSHLHFDWATALIALLSGFSVAAVFYLWFWQVPTVISRSRLLLAAGAGFLLASMIYLFLSLDPLKIKAASKNLHLSTLDVCLLVSLLVCLVLIGVERAPYNLPLLPRYNLRIEVLSPPGKAVELKTFHNGLSNISYSAFQVQGDWQRTEDSFRTTGGEGALLNYRGWLVDEPSLLFKSGSDGGILQLGWADQSSIVNLQSSAVAETLVKLEVPAHRSNRTSTLVITILALTILLFPIGFIILHALSKKGFTLSLDEWFTQFIDHLQPILILLLAVSFLASATLLASPLFTHDAPSAAPASPASPLPNLILIIVDALGAEDMSLYGYPLPTTPNLEKITQDWTVYTHAYSTETCSIGVFPTLMTGHYPIYQSPYYRFGELIRESDEWINLNQVLQENGYTTWWNGHMSAGFYHAGYGVQRTLFEPWNAPLVRAWFQFPGVRSKTFPYIPLNLHLAKSLHEPIGWYDALEDLRKEFASNTFQPPFFLYLHYGGVHGIPYRAGEFLGAFLPIESGLTDTSSQLSAYGAYAAEQQLLADQLRLRYDEAILNQDQELGRLIDSIKGAGLYDSSMIILMADHGQNFKQGYTSHCTPLLSNPEAHVPLLIKYPHQTSGSRVDALVTTADLTPTILDALGFHLQTAWFDGMSLLSTDEESFNERLIFLRNSYESLGSSSFAVMSRQYKLVKRGSEYFLFDYLIDKEEEQNLLGSIDPAEAQRLQDALQSFIQQTK